MTFGPVWASGAHQAPPTIALSESRRVDVAVIGAGYMGVTAALALATGGARVAVVEKGALAAGASGLNGGQVIPGLKSGPSELIARLGRERGEAVIRYVTRSAERVFELVREYGMDCEFVRSGWIQAAASRAALPEIKVRVAECNQWGGDAVVLEAHAVQSLLGSRTGAYRGGWLDRNAGTLQPLNYLYGLVRAAQGAGADIYTESSAAAISRQRELWQLRLAHGPTLSADSILVCTNAYTDDLWPGLRQSVLPASSLQLATAPLSASLLAQILPQRQAVSESRRVMNYFRIGPQGRLVFGGRGPFRTAQPRDYDELIRGMVRLYPQLQGVPVEYCWAGKVALTRDYLPHVHQPRPGLWLALGCNGRGIGLMSALGTSLGQQLLGRSATHPFGVTPLRPLPLHRLHKLYASGLIQYFRLLDRLS